MGGGAGGSVEGGVGIVSEDEAGVVSASACAGGGVEVEVSMRPGDMNCGTW